MIALNASVIVAVTVLAQSGWSVAGGAERFTLRDISRGGPPADASPVKWTGDGPSLFVVHERATTRRAHRVTVDFAAARSFTYASPVRRVDAPSSDRATRFEGRYEYRRYVLRDRFVRGLSGGIGVEGMGRRVSLLRGLSPAEQHVTSLAAGVAVVAAAHFDRYARWRLEATWTNGLAFASERNAHSADSLSRVPSKGGEWFTDLSVSGAARLSARAWLMASFLDTGEGSAVSHHSYAFARRRLAVGVTYGR